ncbi:hypothetical protein SCHPADRAFT_416267 [Schizopora paradoxa]|uniref:Uncharacterized protein n=1 Tax=Schizopora paradoxa TaxID=27342 RepID=A0A0H2RLL3_9AGAM|nr:hypothetical protein SCHPADRAFT_416267 [Schizopora paradoxa]
MSGSSSSTASSGQSNSSSTYRSIHSDSSSTSIDSTPPTLPQMKPVVASMSGSQSTVSSSQSDSSSTHRSVQSNSSITSIDLTPCSSLNPRPQKKAIAVPILPPNLSTPEQFHPPPSSSQKAKTRVLGMRRYATSPSNSQQAVTPAPVGAPLPTKQKQFKPPLTKRSASLLATIQAAVSTPYVAPEKPNPPPAFQPAAKSVKMPSAALPPAKSTSAPSKDSKPNDSFDSMEMDLDDFGARPRYASN